MEIFSKFYYIAPNDLQIPRVDRQSIVYFCEALYKKSIKLELVTYSLKTTYEKYDTNSPLDLYRIETQFPVKVLTTPAKQTTNKIIVQVYRFAVYFIYISKILFKAGKNECVVFYVKNYSIVLILRIMNFLINKNIRIIFELHIPPKNRYQKYVLTKANGINCNTYKLAKDLKADYGFNKEKLIGTHQGVNIELINKNKLEKEDAKRILKIPKETFVAMYAGTVYKGNKEILYYLEAAKELPKNVVIYIVGGRSDHVEYFTTYIKDNDIKNIIFTGFVEPKEIDIYLSSADLFLLYYNSDRKLNKYGSPSKLFEYLAHNKPLICVDIPIIREVIGEKPPVELVQPDNPIELRKSIISIRNNYEQYLGTSESAYKLVQEFTWDKRADKLIDFIKNLK
ncbi:MAG: glycosyltransferase [Ignavibacteria bacterium]